MAVTTPKAIIALDVGERRIGIAVATRDTRLPRTAGVIEHTADVVERIRETLKEHNVDTLVVGLPRGLEGQETQQTKMVRAFGEQLQQKLNTPIIWQDEALTSHHAEQELITRGTRYTKGDIDALAAVYILTDYLRESEEL